LYCRRSGFHPACPLVDQVFIPADRLDGREANSRDGKLIIFCGDSEASRARSGM
jgi:hypothetical protein